MGLDWETILDAEGEDLADAWDDAAADALYQDHQASATSSITIAPDTE